jgi:hypothetical protein
MGTMKGPRRPAAGGLASFAGVLLVGLGALLLAAQLVGGVSWPAGGWLGWGNTWPLLPIGVGLGALLLALAGGPEWGWLAVPGSVVTAVGLLLLFDHFTDQWQTWAYTWALVVPTAVGAGLWLQGRWSARPELVARGGRLIALGLGLWAAFGVFFELGLNLSGVFAEGYARYLVPLLLIAAGGYLLLRRRRRWPSGDGDGDGDGGLHAPPEEPPNGLRPAG